MVATATRIGFIQTEFRKATAESDTAFARYGSLARESDDPVETFFDDVADAQTMADERLALLSQERRRFRVQVNGVAEALALDLSAGIPVARYIDSERDCDRNMLVSEIVFDFAKDTTTMTLWG